MILKIRSYIKNHLVFLFFLIHNYNKNGFYLLHIIYIIILVLLYKIHKNYSQMYFKIQTSFTIEVPLQLHPFHHQHIPMLNHPTFQPTLFVVHYPGNPKCHRYQLEFS